MPGNRKRYITVVHIVVKKIKKGSTYAIIGARGGSKTIPKKNIKDVGGFPLIAYSIAAAKLAKDVERVIVSTDSEEIAEVAKKYGAEVPFRRPREFATDTSIDREFIVHALEWLEKHEGSVPQYLLFLRPTSPLRDPKKLSEAIAHIKKFPESTSLRSAHKIELTPQKMYGLEGDYFVGLFPRDKRPEYHGLPRQTFPPTYKPDGYVDVLKSEFILNNPGQTHGDSILAFHTPDTGDIDNMNDLEYVEEILNKNQWEIYEYLKNSFHNQKI